MRPTSEGSVTFPLHPGSDPILMTTPVLQPILDGIAEVSANIHDAADQQLREGIREHQATVIEFAIRVRGASAGWTGEWTLTSP